MLRFSTERCFRIDFSVRQNQVNFLVYSKKNRVKIKKQHYLILRVGIFLKLIFCIKNTLEKPAIYN